MFSPFQKKKGIQEDFSIKSDLVVPREEVSVPPSESQAGEEPIGSILVNKGHMDKRSLDLVFAVEQMIKSKQHLEVSYNDSQDRLSHLGGQNDRLNKDLKNLSKVIEEREKSILELEQRLSDKNLKVDQMMEDYRELQSTLSSEIDELKTVIEFERQNYKSLSQKYNETTSDKNKKISELEEKNSRYEVELSQMKKKLDAVYQEKTHLLNIVNDFTNRLTSPFGSGTNVEGRGSAD